VSSSSIALTGTAAPRFADGVEAYAPVRNAPIQYLRAFAAFFVVLSHASLVDGRFAVFGVSLFFAISGYLMAGLVRSTEPFRFLSHRVLRIYPIFFLVVASSFVASRLLGSPFSFDLLSMTLAPVGLRSFSLGGIEWTLVFEVSYYTALFILACARLQRHLNLVAAIWIGAIIASTLLMPSLGNRLYLPAHLLFLAPANLAFACGLLLPSAIARGYLPRASTLLIIPVALSYDYVDLGTSRMLSGVAALCLVGWAAQTEQLPKFPGSKLLFLLGEWSYALYLCHVPILKTVAFLWPQPIHGLSPQTVALAITPLLLVFFGSLDMALYRKLRSLADLSRPRTLRIAMGAFVAAFLGLAVYGSVVHILDGLRDDRIRSTLRTLGPKAQTSPEAASARISETGLSAPNGLHGVFEQADAVADDKVVYRGWATTEGGAADDIAFRAFCSNRQIGIVWHQRKLRPDIAESLGRQDLAKKRIGFTLFVAQQACPKGSKAFVIGFDAAGRAAVLSGVNGL